MMQRKGIRSRKLHNNYESEEEKKSNKSDEERIFHKLQLKAVEVDQSEHIDHETQQLPEEEND